MKKYTLFIFIILILLGCASDPEIIKKMIPVKDDNNEIKNITIKGEKDNVVITIRYMDRMELFKIAEDNNPYLDDDTPLLTTFMITIENKRKSKIHFDIKNAVLLDGLGHQFQALTTESFKSLYPSTIYQQYEYSFVFNPYMKEAPITDDFHKQNQATKTLFKGGYIYSGITVEGILPFERLTDYVSDVTIILSDINLYSEKDDTDKDSKKTIKKVIEFQYKFKQKIERIED